MARQLKVEGVVQGVGYRYGFHRRACALQLSGWVRNRSDGSVEAIVSGPPDVVEQMIAWARRGPDGASVTGVTVSDANGSQLTQGKFEIWPTE